MRRSQPVVSGSLPVCVVIYGGDLKALRRQAEQAKLEEASLVEVRLDLCPDPLSLPIEKLRFPPLKTILTVRDPLEGGKPLDSDYRIEVLSRAIGSAADYVDIEIRNLDVLDWRQRPEGQLIFSQHWFNEMPSIRELRSISEKHGSNGILKLVPTALEYADNFRILSFVQEASEKGRKIIAFCMGAKGVPSRVLSPLAGAVFSYACLGGAVAPGQLQITEFRRLYYALKGEC
ncbi:MAG: type I 3-dehydroquinate dehydratase [Candidatus Ranarchaeia archaeon]